MSKSKQKYQIVYEVEVDNPRKLAALVVELYGNVNIQPTKIVKFPLEDPTVIPFDIVYFLEYGMHNNYKNEKEFINKCKESEVSYA